MRKHFYAAILIFISLSIIGCTNSYYVDSKAEIKTDYNTRINEEYKINTRFVNDTNLYLNVNKIHKHNIYKEITQNEQTADDRKNSILAYGLIGEAGCVGWYKSQKAPAILLGTIMAGYAGYEIYQIVNGDKRRYGNIRFTGVSKKEKTITDSVQCPILENNSNSKKVKIKYNGNEITKSLLIGKELQINLFTELNAKTTNDTNRLIISIDDSNELAIFPNKIKKNGTENYIKISETTEGNNDETNLGDIIYWSNNNDDKINAAQQITNQEIMQFLLNKFLDESKKNEDDPDKESDDDISKEQIVKIFANKINNYWIYDYLSNSKIDELKRIRIINDIDNQKNLHTALSKVIEYSIKNAIMKRITNPTDEELLEFILNTNTSDEAKLFYTKLISNQMKMQLLLNKILNDNDIKGERAEKIFSTNYSDREAIDILANKINSDWIREYLLNSKVDENKRIRVIGLLDDKNNLHATYYYSTEYLIKSAIVNRLTDPTDEELLDIVFNSNTPEEKKILLSNKIKKQSSLIKLFNGTDLFELKQIAFNKMDEKSLKEMLTRKDNNIYETAVELKFGRTNWKEVIKKAESGEFDDRLIVTTAALLINNDPETSDILPICHRYIRQGDSSRIKELVNLLDRFGDKYLAEDYMNCGERTLEDAGCKWGTNHGYACTSGNGSSRVTWGRKK